MPIGAGIVSKMCRRSVGGSVLYLATAGLPIGMGSAENSLTVVTSIGLARE
jgi:hypothetical protein